MPSAYSISFGPLALAIEPLCASCGKLGRDLVALSATVTTDSSSATLENLTIALQDLISYRRRLRKFVAAEDDGAVSLKSGMPHLDITLTERPHDYVHVELRLSPDIRHERHIYEFETTHAEVAAFTDALDLALLSLSLR